MTPQHSVRPSLHIVSPCPRTSTQHATEQTSSTRTDKRRARLLSDKCQALIPARLSFFSPHIKNPTSAFCLCLSHGGPHLPSLSHSYLPHPLTPEALSKGCQAPGKVELSIQPIRHICIRISTRNEGKAVGRRYLAPAQCGSGPTGSPLVARPEVQRKYKSSGL